MRWCFSPSSYKNYTVGLYIYPDIDIKRWQTLEASLSDAARARIQVTGARFSSREPVRGTPGLSSDRSLKDEHVETNANFKQPAASRPHHRGLHGGSAVLERPRTRARPGAPSGRGRRGGAGRLESRVFRPPIPAWHRGFPVGDSGRQTRPRRGAVRLRRARTCRGNGRDGPQLDAAGTVRSGARYL